MLDYFVKITNRERSSGSNRWVKVGRGQLWSDKSPTCTQQRFFTATECFSKNFGREHENAPNVLTGFKISLTRNFGEIVNVDCIGIKTKWCIEAKNGGSVENIEVLNLNHLKQYSVINSQPHHRLRIRLLLMNGEVDLWHTLSDWSVSILWHHARMNIEL